LRGTGCPWFRVRSVRSAELRPPPDTVALQGIFKNFNTIEEFKSTESKKDIFNSVVNSILSSFESDSPDLNPFLLVTFADLKKYVYHYWFAFPALVAKPGWEIKEDGLDSVEDEVRLHSVTQPRLMSRR
jgi:ubiquitin-like modifier-activating enzyme ATG7